MHRSTLVRFSRVCALVTPLVLVGGCAISDPDVWPKDFVQKKALRQLVGKHEDEVWDELGPPRYFLNWGGSVSYLYQSLEEDSAVLVLLPWLYGSNGIEASCVLLHFDEIRVLREYEIRTAGAVTSFYRGHYDCRTLFGVDDNDLLNIEPCVYKRTRGNLWAHEDYLKYLSPDLDVSTRLSYLCHAADAGHPNAQTEVGRHFAQGNYGIRKDLRRAYVWYSLSNTSAIAQSRGCVRKVNSHLELIEQEMTPEDIAEAENMLTDWEPEQCQRDLLGVSAAPTHK